MKEFSAFEGDFFKAKGLLINDVREVRSAALEKSGIYFLIRDPFDPAFEDESGDTEEIAENGVEDPFDNVLPTLRNLHISTVLEKLLHFFEILLA